MTDTSGDSPVSVVDDSVSLVTHDAADRDSFPFFDLPPELRNMIYLFSVKDTQAFRRYGISVLKLVDYFQPSLQRVSKQFRHEYGKEVLKSAAISSFIGRFHGLCPLNWQVFTYCRALTRMEFHMNLGELRATRPDWIHERLRECVKALPSVTMIQVKINLFVYQYDNLIDKGYISNPEDLLQLPPVGGDRVKVKPELFLHSRLFKVLNPCQDSEGEADHVSQETPMVTFRASPSAGFYTYKGLDLELESIGNFDESCDLCGIGSEDEEGWKSLYKL